MKVTLCEKSLLVEAETEFEQNWCSNFIQHGETGIAFLKCGLTARDVIGIKIEPCYVKEA